MSHRSLGPPLIDIAVSLVAYAVARYSDNGDGFTGLLCFALPAATAVTMQTWDKYPSDQHIWTLTGLAFLIFFTRSMFSVRRKLLITDLDRVLDDILSLVFTGTGAAYAIVSLREHDKEVCALAVGAVHVGLLVSSISSSYIGGAVASLLAVYGHAAFHEMEMLKAGDALFCAWIASLITESSKDIFSTGDQGSSSMGMKHLLPRVTRASFISLCAVHYVSTWRSS
eukprot:1003292-Rhodomonas_salina.1